MLFARLSDDLFKPLASPSRAFNAALLLHLHARVFAETTEPLRKSELLASIGDFSADWSQGEIADDDATPADPIERRSAVYRRLLEAGWLVERRERYVPVVDFDPDARHVIEELARIDRGETRSYGGAVLEVLGSLESAVANPAERSEALVNAAKASRAFLGHLRSLAGSMRKIEERILREEDQGTAFRLYFEEFVARHLVSDYRTLHTRLNPFRFRSGIVREAGRALRDPLTIRALAEAGLREGRAADLPLAERAVRRDLAEILSIFEGLDRHLDSVADIVARLERRIAASLRYTDHRDSDRIERTAAALRAVRAAEWSDLAPLAQVSLLRPPIGEPHFYTPRMRRTAILSEPLPEIHLDPAIEAFILAKDAFRQRVMVTPERVIAFVERKLGTNPAIRGSEIVVADVDEFVVFQRLREIDVLFDGLLNDRYRLTRVAGRVSNGWLDCPDFMVERSSPPPTRGPASAGERRPRR
ncbi:Wadjet anti-phage system protein JetA family protein [Methylobacterium sp. WCS2018Hpa-22]|uniref:Wadjet anti-phage system protein JetA family protein n=1 Tax=Methylobacterium sp. WCS2018Hpa-22 TaxID=3073633 RepID=UPI00288A4502|nr:Wadjet anti-phage system protein JetA family protein [Methylobacterium sp. WCS2018Hpa-22]